MNPLKYRVMIAGLLAWAAGSACSSAEQSTPSPTGDGGAGGVAGPDELILQEDELGFSAIDGKVLPREGSTSLTGYTGSGFADADPGLGTTISWSVSAASAGSYDAEWRYAFGGTEENVRDARVLVNGNVVLDQVLFPYTSDWNNWQLTSPVQLALESGSNFIQLEALYPGGLANIDYLKLTGPGLAPDTPKFSLEVGTNDAAWGSVTFSPEQEFYEIGSVITLEAVPAAGYFFQSYTGDVQSAEPTHSFAITGNTLIEARFLPEGTTQAPELVGYASVQDDEGTPYLVTGGALGEVVTATGFDELKGYLESPEPLVVEFSGLVEGADAIQVTSHKTLLGVGDSAHLKGIELSLSGSRNVILQNIAVSHVVAAGAGTANDAIVLTGAQNVWIDHCELFSDLDNGKDYYDGLLEIKNESRFITVSHTEFHHHFKVSLVSSGDEQVTDTAIRVTYHHNFFHDTGSRLPSIRFGKAHVFNNYYLDNLTGSAVNSRMDAVVRVEGNYFENTKDPIGSWDSSRVGSWQVNDNVFDTCTGSQPTESTGALEPPYAYELEPAEDLPLSVPEAAGVGRL